MVSVPISHVSGGESLSHTSPGRAAGGGVHSSLGSPGVCGVGSLAQGAARSWPLVTQEPQVSSPTLLGTAPEGPRPRECVWAPSGTVCWFISSGGSLGEDLTAGLGTAIYL